VSARRAAEPTPNLWRNRDFARLWFAQVISTAGTAVTGLALPITAVVLLHAGLGQMSILSIAGFAPNLAFGLFAGVWVDRARRRPILVGADLGRALLLATVPLAAILGVVTFAQLVLVACAVGTLSACSSLAAVAILPAIVPREQLVAANSRLATTDAALALAAPTLAGGLIQLVGAPRAILADALSYLGSALTLRRLRAVEGAAPLGGWATVWREMGAGLRELVRTPALRALTVAVSVGTCGTAMQGVASALFLVNDLHLTPALLGLLGACGGAGDPPPRRRPGDRPRPAGLGGRGAGRAPGPTRADAGPARRRGRRYRRLRRGALGGGPDQPAPGAHAPTPLRAGDRRAPPADVRDADRGRGTRGRARLGRRRACDALRRRPGPRRRDAAAGVLAHPHHPRSR